MVVLKMRDIGPDFLDSECGSIASYQLSPCLLLAYQTCVSVPGNYSIFLPIKVINRPLNTPNTSANPHLRETASRRYPSGRNGVETGYRRYQTVLRRRLDGVWTTSRRYQTASRRRLDVTDSVWTPSRRRCDAV
eukprot:sb/3474788/